MTDQTTRETPQAAFCYYCVQGYPVAGRASGSVHLLPGGVEMLCEDRPFESQPTPTGEGSGRFRKKPVVIEAFRWTGDNWPELAAWHRGDAFLTERQHDGALWLVVRTRHGFAYAGPGDMVCRQMLDGVPDLWPCAADIFAATYEPAEVPTPTGEGSGRGMEQLCIRCENPMDPGEAGTFTICSACWVTADNDGGPGIVRALRDTLAPGAYGCGLHARDLMERALALLERQSLPTPPASRGTEEAREVIRDEIARRVQRHYDEAAAILTRVAATGSDVAEDARVWLAEHRRRFPRRSLDATVRALGAASRGTGVPTSERLAEIEARANVASQGPWFVWRTETRGLTVQRAAGFVAEMAARGTDEDAAFIAHAREDVPWLLEQVRTLSAAAEQGERDLEDAALLSLCEDAVHALECTGQGGEQEWRAMVGYTLKSGPTPEYVYGWTPRDVLRRIAARPPHQGRA